MKKESLKVLKAAMRLVDSEASAAVKFAEEEGESSSAKLEMVVYSGGIIKDHWWWGDLSIDLSGLSFPKKFPILEDHNTDKKIGFGTKVSLEDNKLSIADSVLLNTEESIKFQEASKAGFPYEASLYAKPTKIQRLMENEVADVNGYQMKGPGTIWRKAQFKEASVCTFGYDSNTSSKALSEENSTDIEVEVDEITENTEVVMTKDKFKGDFPDEYAKIVSEVSDAAVAGVEAKFSEQIKELGDKVKELTEENAKLSKEIEKEKALNEEARLASEADAVFVEKFKDSGVPARLEPKIRRLVDYNQFVEGGVLDAEKFSAALIAEFADWVVDEGSVNGLSSVSRTVADEASKNTDTVARILGHLK